MYSNPTSLVDILQWRAENEPHNLAFRFLADGEYEEVIMTYEELDRRARSMGALLQASAKVGDRALILFPPGLDFIAAYLGCLYAKILAIPAYPPHPARMDISLPIIQRIVADSDAAAILLSKSLFEAINSRDEIKSEFGNARFLVTDHHEMNDLTDQWQEPDIECRDIAFLQYTSGSTSTPRGVMVSHRNLLHNMGMIEDYLGVSNESHAVIWLPPYHDMGLIGGILQPLYSGIPVTLMPHMMFLQRPFRWLQALSRFHGTMSAGPNFAYDLCVRKIKPEQRQLLDLSSWKVAFIGAEPIYHKTLDRFADYFAPCGFHREAFVPCYGLAESTLFVTGGIKGRSPIVQHFFNKGLEHNKAVVSTNKIADTRALVSCGKNNAEQQVKIVNTKTMTSCQADEIGEIWVKGPSVANGYWNKTSETEFIFNAQLSGSKEGSFLRTGDIGFFHNDELYVTGRLKNVIVYEGKNYLSHDIERTVEVAHPMIRPSGCAAFSILNDGHEDLIIVVELENKGLVNEEEVFNAIRHSVSVNHGLHVHDIKLTKPGAIARTTSGKIRHFLCKENYMAGNLKEIETT